VVAPTVLFSRLNTSPKAGHVVSQACAGHWGDHSEQAVGVLALTEEMGTMQDHILTEGGREAGGSH
jgi:hypothetical protein